MKNQLVTIAQLRLTLGILGVLLPFIVAFGGLYFGCDDVQGSISSYYHTRMAWAFIGIIFCYAILLFCYKGYEVIDEVAAKAAAVFALGLVIFPTDVDKDSNCQIDPWNLSYDDIHLTFASLFLFVLSLMSFFLFTKTQGAIPTPNKRRRNIIYRVSAIVMWIAMGLIVIYKLLELKNVQIANSVKNLSPIWSMEALVLVAFGLSWLTFFAYPWLSRLVSKKILLATLLIVAIALIYWVVKSLTFHSENTSMQFEAVSHLAAIKLGMFETNSSTIVEENTHPIFWLETISLWAFGISWITKSKILYLKDEEEGFRANITAL